MLSLRLFLMILVPFVCMQQGSGAPPRVEWSVALIAIGGCVLGFGLLAKMAAVAVLVPQTQLLAAGATPTYQALTRFEKSRRTIEWLWVATLPAILLLTGWTAWCNWLQSSGMPQVIVVGLISAPTFAVFGLWEWCAAQLDSLGRDDSGRRTRARWLERLRLGEFAHLSAALLPVALIGLASDAIQWIWPESSAAATCLGAAAPGLGATLVIYPSLYQLSFPTRQIGNEQLAARVGRFARQLGIGGLHARVVASNGRWCGAAVIGVLPQLRHLWLGDGLLEILSPRQVDLVVLHELAHIRRRHFLWRIVPVVWAGVTGGFFWAFQSELALAGWAKWSLSTAVYGTCVLMVAVGLSWISRLCEFDADMQACEYALGVCNWADGSRERAAGELIAALQKLMDSDASRRRSWLHPSLTERVSHLRRWCERGGEER